VRVLVVSGIWPPDVGGPASHAPEVADWLAARGHEVEVLTTAAREPEQRAYPVRWVARSLPAGVRHLAVASRIAQARPDVVYATSMAGRTSLGTFVSRRPFVLKLAGDAAFERALRTGAFDGTLDRFEQEATGVRVWALRAARNLAVRRAVHVVCPSSFLRELAVSWGVPPERVSVLPNPAPRVALPPRDELRSRLGVDGPTLAFAGRLTRPKALAIALEALEHVDDVSLVLAGDGEERKELERRAAPLDGRVRFLGALPRAQVLETVAAADALLLSSTWENFPHAVVEALAVGTPVIATDVGGVAEVVRDGENGLLVTPGDPQPLADAIRRFFADEALRARLRAGAQATAEELTPDRVYGELEEILRRAAA
jgi:glycosyltransferase involved in cell wall biosynthesis